MSATRSSKGLFKGLIKNLCPMPPERIRLDEAPAQVHKTPPSVGGGVRGGTLLVARSPCMPAVQHPLNTEIPIEIPIKIPIKIPNPNPCSSEGKGYAIPKSPVYIAVPSHPTIVTFMAPCLPPAHASSSPWRSAAWRPPHPPRPRSRPRRWPQLWRRRRRPCPPSCPWPAAASWAAICSLLRTAYRMGSGSTVIDRSCCRQGALYHTAQKAIVSCIGGQSDASSGPLSSPWPAATSCTACLYGLRHFTLQGFHRT